MKLRWPLYKDTCWECDHVSLHWQKPWYRPITPSEQRRMIAEMWAKAHEDFAKFSEMRDLNTPPLFSSDAVITIPRITNADVHDS